MHAGLDPAGNRERHSVLESENVFERVLEPLGPQLRAVGRVDQFDRNANPTCIPSDAALKQVGDAQPSTDFLRVQILPFKRQARPTRNHKDCTDPGECGRDLLKHAVNEIFLLGVARDVRERHDGDRGPAGPRFHLSGLCGRSVP